MLSGCPVVSSSGRRLLRRLSGGGATKATGTRVLFLRGCEGEAVIMWAETIGR